MPCFVCSAPTHPATAAEVYPDVVYCGPCLRHAIQFCKDQFRRTFKKEDFYAAAVTSIREGRPGPLDAFSTLLLGGIGVTTIPEREASSVTPEARQEKG